MAEALIIGCGYTGIRLGRTLREAGHAVTGTTRSPERAAVLESEGFRPLLLDLSGRGAARRALAGEAPDVCFYLAPPLDPEPGTEVEEVIRALVRAPLLAFVYASSTAVYGDRGGEIVDESALPRPDSPAGRARLATERYVLRAGWEQDCRPRILRIGGIYGPGRTLRDPIQAGRYHLIEGTSSWSNRIHVDDLARVLIAAWLRGSDGRIYNAVDDEPHPSEAFARFVADACGLSLPVIGLEEARTRYGPDRLARKLASKRISNRRMHEELGVELRYPTYREGLRAALHEEAGGRAEEG